MQAWLAVNLTADLQDSFTWNTRQIYLWLTAEYKTERNQLNQAVFWNWIIESKVKARITPQSFCIQTLACFDRLQSFSQHLLHAAKPFLHPDPSYWKCVS